MTSNVQIQTPASGDEAATLQIEQFIAQLLRVGVILSFLIVTFGVACVSVSQQTGYRQAHVDDLNSLIAYHDASPDFPRSLSEVWDGLKTARPYAIISLGLLVLIAIPMLRVVASVVAFALQRDWMYVAITGFVLSVLILSFVVGEAGG
jgi:uncharacterized membrane protein